MKKLNTQTTSSIMVCTVCGQCGIPIRRITGQDRHKGHLKTLWCCNCKKDTRHKEIRSWDLEKHKTLNEAEKRKQRMERRGKGMKQKREKNEEDV